MTSVPTLLIVYASTSGHTEYVVGHIADALRHGADVVVSRVEHASAAMLLDCDALLLASGTWNTGGVEGQLNPHMQEFLMKKAKDIDLAGKKVAIVALGDARYRYTAKAGDHLQQFVESHGGVLLGERLKIVNEPYGQEEVVKAWAKNLSALLA